MKQKTKSNRGYELGYPRICPLGDAAVIVQFGSKIDNELNQLVLSLETNLVSAKIPGLFATIPSYASLTIHYDASLIDFQSIQDELLMQLDSLENTENEQGRLLEIPVFYGGKFGPDLDSVAQHCKLTTNEVIRRHAAHGYWVYFIGFLPGFPYLGGLDESIATPRLSTPRTLVKAGSVGIAGSQTGVYPLDSPGGWRIIGWTPFKLFDSFKDPPSFLQPGDRVKFIPMPEKENPDA